MKTLIDFFRDKSSIPKYLSLVVKYAAMPESEATRIVNDRSMKDYDVFKTTWLCFFVTVSNPKLSMDKHIALTYEILEIGDMIDMELVAENFWDSCLEYWDSQDNAKLAQFGPKLTPQEVIDCIAQSGESYCQACGCEWKDHHERCEGSANESATRVREDPFREEPLFDKQARSEKEFDSIDFQYGELERDK